MTQTVKVTAVGLGQNEYEAGALAIPANTALKEGVLLKRATGGGFEPAAAGDTAVAVLTVEFEAAAQARSVGIRALVAGSVRRDMLHFVDAPTTALTAAQCDALRLYSIIPQGVTSVSRTDV